MSIANLVVDLIEPSLAISSTRMAGAAFFDRLRSYGARAIFSRSLDAVKASNVLVRLSPPGWEALYAERRFQDANYLDRALRSRSRSGPFRWSEIRPSGAAERALSQALRDCGFPDGLAVPWQGPAGHYGVTSLAFERLNALAPAERRAITLATAIVNQHFQTLTAPPSPVGVLSARERECLAHVAAGRSDAEIANLLAISQTTAISHVRNARVKLGARSRAQAVAAALLAGLL